MLLDSTLSRRGIVQPSLWAWVLKMEFLTSRIFKNIPSSQKCHSYLFWCYSQYMMVLEMWELQECNNMDTILDKWNKSFANYDHRKLKISHSAPLFCPSGCRNPTYILFQGGTKGKRWGKVITSMFIKPDVHSWRDENLHELANCHSPKESSNK